MWWRRDSGLVLAFVVATAVGCFPSPPDHARETRTPRAADARAASRQAPLGPEGRDLGGDEARGGHTLSRHVGLADADLRDRLKRESTIAAASTYDDRATAEQVVGAALADNGRRVDEWVRRPGRKPNLAIRYRDETGRTLGRLVRRGERTVRFCRDAVIVLKWDEARGDFFVLTSYPEFRR